VEGLAEGLVRLARDPEARRRMGDAGRRHVQDFFSLERMVADYRRICLPSA
jgi:glycosyltransferase involved in cell wall biosynthesis